LRSEARCATLAVYVADRGLPSARGIGSGLTSLDWPPRKTANRKPSLLRLTLESDLFRCVPETLIPQSTQKWIDFMTQINWATGDWSTEPARVEIADDGMRVTAAEGSDAWRITSYGFIHNNAHALLAPLKQDTAVEVSFALNFSEQFDQAGVFLRVNDTEWIKAGIEWSDGEENLGAVVTRGQSDWSLGPASGWAGRNITVRASWSGDAVTIRARADEEEWRLVRVAPLSSEAEVTAGPYCCAPSRAGLVVHFTSWRVTDADTSLHAGPPAPAPAPAAKLSSDHFSHE